jgi:hypothetical protein
MKKTLLFAILGIAFPLVSFGQLTTDSLTSPRVWLSADRSQLSGTKWSDLSLFKNDATGTSAVSTPSTYSSINFNKALVFDGIDDYFKIPHSLEGLAELSVLAVFQSADTTERGVWGTEQALSRNILLTTRRAIGPDTIADRYGKNEKVTVLTSVMQNWDKVGTSSANAFMSLGSAGVTKKYKAFQGSLAELIVFDRGLTFVERVQYESYLAIKYGTGIIAGNFVSSGEKLLWHGERNAGYGKHIAGLGRDDFFKLYQKQSGSAYDSGLLLMSVGALAANNPANPGAINNQDFILWGDNGLPLSTKPGVGADSILSFVQRKWLVTATGTTASKLATELYVDINKLPKEPLGYWLVIDRSGQGNFSVDNLEYILPDRIANGKVVYKNVMWDKDGSGKDNFGFARTRNLLALVRKLNNPSCTDETAGKVRIEVIAGKAPYTYKLVQKDGTITREWKQSTTTSEQKDLVKGEYTLTFTDDTRESLSRKFTMVMPDALQIDLGPDQKLSPTQPIVLDVSKQIPDSIQVSYRWENSFGFSSTDKKITAAESGVYRVFVTKAKDGCVFTDEVTITGADEQRVAVYPTVLNKEDPYNVGVSLAKAGSVAVKVFNARGILVSDMEGRGRSEYQFITTLKDSGLYVVVVQTPQGMESHKIIVY